MEHEGVRREGIVTRAVEEGRGENIWNKVREVGMGQNIQGLVLGMLAYFLLL